MTDDMGRIRAAECFMSVVMLYTACHALCNVAVQSNERMLALLSAQGGTLVLLSFVSGVGYHRRGARNPWTVLLLFVSMAVMQLWLALTTGLAASVRFAFYYSWAFLAARLLLITAEVQIHGQDLRP